MINNYGGVRRQETGDRRQETHQTRSQPTPNPSGEGLGKSGVRSFYH
ncbi:MAG: hypothetical protein AB4080_10300 [Trichodesmium sp.]